MRVQSHHRTEQVADIIKREVAHILLFEVRDPRINNITVTQVRMSADLKEARIYFDCCGQEEERLKIEKCLSHSSGFIRHELAGRLSMRTVPRLHFFYDDTREVHNTAERILGDIKW